MEQHTIETGADVVTVIAEPGALTFATRKEWRELPESGWDELTMFDVKKVFKGTCSIFFLLRNFLPLRYFEDTKKDYRLLKITTDEDEKLKIYCMDISTAEGQQMLQNRLTLWD